MAEQKLGSAVLELKTGLQRFGKELDLAYGKAKDFQSKLTKFGKQTTQLGKSLTRSLTLPLVGFAAAATKMSMDFEASMSKIVGLVGVSRTQVNAWSDDLLEMSINLGKAPKQLADAMFFITSAGLRGAEAFDALTMAAKASVGGLGDMNAIADALTSAMNAYGSETLSAEAATNILVATVREGKLEAADLAGSIGRVIPLTAQMGVEFNELGAVIASLTRIGFSADDAVTSLQGILSGLLKPTQQAEDALKRYGLTSEMLRKQIKEKGLIAALTDLKEQVGDNDAAMAEIFPNVRALRGALGLLGENAEETQEIMKSMVDTTGALDKAFEEASNTFKQRFNRSIVQLKTALVKIGNVVAPVIIPAIEKLAALVGRLADWFADLDPGMQKFLLALTVIAALIGPLLIAVGAMIKIFVTLKAALAAAKIAMLAFNASLLTNPIFLVVAALAALGVAIGLSVASVRNAKKAQANFNDELLDTNKLMEEYKKKQGEVIENMGKIQSATTAVGLKTIEELEAEIKEAKDFLGSAMAQAMGEDDFGIQRRREALALLEEELEVHKAAIEAGKEEEEIAEDLKKSWRIYKADALSALADQLYFIDQQDKKAKQLGENYNAIEERIAALNDTVDELLDISLTEIDDPFKMVDNTIQALISSILELEVVLRRMGPGMGSSLAKLWRPGGQKVGAPPGEQLTEGAAGRAGGLDPNFLAFIRREAGGQAGADLSGMGGLGEMGSMLAGADPLSMFIASATKAAMSVENLAGALNGLGTIFGSMIEILKPALNSVFEPIINYFRMVGESIGQLLLPTLMALTPIMDLFAQMIGLTITPLFEFLAVPMGILGGILIMLEPLWKGLMIALEIVTSPLKWFGDLMTWIGGKFLKLGEWMGLILSGKFLKAKALDFGGKFASDAFTGLGKRLQEIWDKDYGAVTGFGDLADVTTGGGGRGATFEQQRPIYVAIDIHDNDVFGGSLREFALIIRDEFESIGVLGI